MNPLTAALDGRRIYLDANVFVYFLDGTGAQAERAAAVLRAADDQSYSAVTGHAAVAEVMVGPYRTGDALVIRSVREFFRQPRLLDIVGHPVEAFDDAAMLRAATGAPFIDALHLATAARAGCDALITNDQRMKPALGVDVIPLRGIAV